jgi:hypothetical protein
MTTLAGILLGLINIAIVVAILMLVGAVIVWGLAMASMPVPAQVQKGFMVVVVLIALYMLVALLLGIPTIHIITSGG